MNCENLSKFYYVFFGTEAANGGVLQIICSAGARKLKLDINYFAEQIKFCLKRGEKGQNLQKFFLQNISNYLGSLKRRKTGQIFKKFSCTHIFNLPGKIM